MDKRGVVGISTGKAVILALMVLAILGFVLVIVMQSLTDVPIAADTGSGYIINETISGITESTPQNLSVFELEDVICTIVGALNTTEGTPIPTTNYTHTGCTLVMTEGPFNGSSWEVTYSYTFNRFHQINANVTGGVEDFFSNAGTWFALLAIVILILIVVIVMKSVSGVDRNKGGL
jgi:uncharacterized integral membrane protein